MNAFVLLQTPAAPEWVLFFGRFHPLVVHLPIGILVIAALIEFAARSPKLAALREANRFVLFWGAVTATLACVIGYMLAQSGGYDEDALGKHQWLGYGVAAAAWVAYLLKNVPGGLLHKAYRPVFGVAVLLLFGAGHYGGNLTHGSDYLTQYMPQPLRAVAGLPPRKEPAAAKKITDINQAVVFTDLVQPTLEQSCVNCHNAEKQKGDLRMDSHEFLLKGGEHGPVLVAGRADESEMLKRIHLPLEDDDHMPPKGKPQPTDQQIALLTWWINQGAPVDKKVAELKVTDDMK
nr:ribonuclease inhibitor [Cytophagales bacterium]